MARCTFQIKSNICSLTGPYWGFFWLKFPDISCFHGPVGTLSNIFHQKHFISCSLQCPHMLNQLQSLSSLTMSLLSSWASFMMKIMSKRDRMVGIKSMLSSPFVSSHRPYTEFAAASTEQREFSVVVMPAWYVTNIGSKRYFLS